MKKNLFTLAVATLCIAVLFSACKSKKSNVLGKYIPAQAAFIAHIDGASLNSKLSWDEVKQNAWFKEMYADSTQSAFAKTLLDNPENSGVDVKGDIILFYVKDSTSNYFTVEGKIIDEAKFKKLLAENMKTAKETVKDGYTYFNGDKASVAYNKERFFATMQGDENRSDYDYVENDSTGVVKQTPVIDYAAINASIIALAEDKSMLKNDKFAGLLAEKGDAHFWLNAKNFAGTGMAGLGALGAMSNINTLYEGVVTTGVVNFENGKIAIDTKSYAGKELTNLYEKYNGGSFNKEMVTSIPSQNLAGVLAFNFKPEGIKEFLKLLKVDGLANIGLAQYGFNIDEFIKANKGDILFAMTDLNADSSQPSQVGNFIFSTSIGDKAAFNKLIDAGKKLTSTMGMGSSSMMDKFGFNVNDKYFAISNNKSVTDAYLNNKAQNNFDFISKLGDSPIAGFANMQYIFKSMKPSASDSLGIETHAANLAIWDNALLSGGKFKDGAIPQHFEINLMDKNTNSLKQLNTYSNTMSAIQKKRELQYSKVWETEDVVAPAIVETK
jgi:hypothetical protein